MEEHFEAYLASLFRDRPRTRLVRHQWLTDFAGFCEEQRLSLGQITFPAIQKYEQRITWSLNASGRIRSATSIDQGLREARTFLRWAVQQGLLHPDPTVGWLLPKPIPRQKKLLSQEHLHKILDEYPGNDPLGMRDRVILRVLAELGFSTRDCHRMDLADLDLGRYRLCRKPMSAQLVDHCRLYLAKGRPALLSDPDEPALLLTRTGTRLGAQSVLVVARRQGGIAISPQLLHRSWLAHRDALLDRRLTDS